MCVKFILVARLARWSVSPKHVWLTACWVGPPPPTMCSWGPCCGRFKSTFQFICHWQRVARISLLLLTVSDSGKALLKLLLPLVSLICYCFLLLFVFVNTCSVVVVVVVEHVNSAHRHHFIKRRQTINYAIRTVHLQSINGLESATNRKAAGSNIITNQQRPLYLSSKQYTKQAAI